jgi:glycosyltransferase involved in cell wall biosynthesis
MLRRWFGLGHLWSLVLKILITAYVRFRNALAWHAFELARAAQSAGHEVCLFCQRDSYLAQWVENCPFETNRKHNLNRIAPQEMWSGLCDLRQTIREFKPDILNPHCPPGHSFLALARHFEKSRIPLIRTVADPRPPARNPLNKILQERATDGFIFTTQSSLRRSEATFDLSQSCQKVILPGFNADEFVSNTAALDLRSQFGLKREQLLVGIIARMSPEKGQEVLLKALHLLKPEERNQIFCIMAGEDSRERGRAQLESMARDFGVERNVGFLGWLNDVRPAMAAFDLGLITSTRSEAVCRVALEYMSYGLPIIASDVNILPEVVRDGSNGWVFPNRNANALAECLREAIASADEKRRRGETGFRMVHDEFSAEHQLAETLAFFEEVKSMGRH